MANLLAAQKAPARLFYGERRGQDLMDRDYLASFAPDFAAAAQDGQGYGEKGLATDLLVRALAQEKRAIFACGPPGLLAALAPLARKLGLRYFAAVEAFMACGLGVCLSCAKALTGGARIRLCQDGPVVDGLSLDWSAP
jgi:dihydroorotate dehydrogenase electron transfer subunit